MAVYRNSRLWQSAFEHRTNDEADAEALRTRLRSSWELARSRAAVLAEQIAVDQPGLTQHDISHLDALWLVADEIVDADFELNPCSGYVLGAAFLVHDLALTLSAFPDPRVLEGDSRYIAALRRAAKTQLGREPDEAEILDPPLEAVQAARQAYLRLTHAEHARRVPTKCWMLDNKDAFYLIDDPELRRMFGPAIGAVASSHWVDAFRLPDLLPGPGINPPAGSPREWDSDLLMLACLLRAADAAHLDSRRAPSFLRALRRPSGISRDHWVFQERMQSVRRIGDRLQFTAQPPFGPSDAPGWWLAFDALKTADDELRAVDHVLSDSGRRQFAARSVAGVTSIDQIVKYLPVDGWEPIDATLRVGDVEGLVAKLGGEALYGPHPELALRELVQNGLDAVRARHTVDAGYEGAVSVVLQDDGSDSELLIRDDGIGMSPTALTAGLLDFGSSYWSSTLAEEEHPELLSSGFRPIGQYGIGFYAVFMLGQEVTVISRRFDAARADTYVLEFRSGLLGRPLLRKASPAERLPAGGTEVKVRLSTSPHEPGGLLIRDGWIQWNLNALLEYLAPASPITIKAADLRDPTVTEATVVIEGNDWTSMSPEALVRRLAVERRLSDRALELTEHADPHVVAFSANLRFVDQSDPERGRLAIVPMNLGGHRSSQRDIEPAGAVVTRGLRAAGMNRVIGVLPGEPRRAARDEATPSTPIGLMAPWASEQARLLHEIGLEANAQMECADVVQAFGGDVGDLAITTNKSVYMTSRELRKWASTRSTVIVADNSDAPPFQGLYGPEYFNYAVMRYMELMDDVIVTDDMSASIAGAIPWPSGPWYRDDERAMLSAAGYAEAVSRSMHGLCLGLIALAWETSVEVLLASHSNIEFGKPFRQQPRVPIATVDGQPVEGRAVVLTR